MRVGALHCRHVLLAVAAIAVMPECGAAQFNVPLPKTTPTDAVLREDVQMLFQEERFVGSSYSVRVDSLRAWVKGAKSNAQEATRLASAAREFCQRRFSDVQGQCLAALHQDSISVRFGEGDSPIARPLTTYYVRSWIPMLYTSRPQIGDYLRRSGGGDAFAVASQFATSVSEDEAYVLTTLVRGLAGRGIFSADQAIVLAKSEGADPEEREAIENAKANALRAINNGGTLVGRYTMPMYVRAGSTAAMAVGMTVSGGVLGPVSGDDALRSGAFSTSLEWMIGIPIRDLSGRSAVLADVLLGFRGGYTYGGDALRNSAGYREVSYGQMLVGLRQNENLSVSALVTIANHGMNSLVPRLSLNLAASR